MNLAQDLDAQPLLEPTKREKHSVILTSARKLKSIQPRKKIEATSASRKHEVDRLQYATRLQKTNGPASLKKIYKSPPNWETLKSFCSSCDQPDDAESGGGEVRDCTTANNTPVEGCFDWITGPASVNPTLKMLYWNKSIGKWVSGTLYETDQGWLVMNPKGDKLELVAYGDTSVKNQNRNVGLFHFWVMSCEKTGVSICAGDKNCQEIFNSLSNKRTACEYLHEYWDRKYFGGGGHAVPAYTDKYGVVFFDAEIDMNRPYHIDFKDHLYEKTVLKNGIENCHYGKFYTTGNYTGDYFYVCPQDRTKCNDREKILYFATGTVYWPPELKPLNELTKEQKAFALTRGGMGFYRFGLLSAKSDSNSGCRVRFSPHKSSKGCPTLKDPSCYRALFSSLQPQHQQLFGLGAKEKVESTSNPNVYWGLGSKFAVAIVAHGFEDKYHSGSPPSSEYVYFIGSDEFRSQAGIVGGKKTVVYKPTGNIYLARMPASEKALQWAQFEYYTGMADGKSQWGGYGDAKPILNALMNLPHLYSKDKPILPGSFTKRFGMYYMAASCNSFNLLNGSYNQGMCITRSRDGFTWQDHDVALYTSAPASGGSMPSRFVYGHAWVPEAVYPHGSSIPYVFSVWKSIDGYYNDFWFQTGNKYPIDPKHRFLVYNTKMYLYKPKSK